MSSAFSSVPWKKKLANIFFPGYSLTLDQVNNNALVNRWIRQNSNVPVFPDRSELYRYIEEAYLEGSAIDYLEFGVFKGASIRFWSELNSNSSSQFIGFDSFLGLPEDWTVKLKKGDFDVAGSIPQISDARVSFVDGWFQNTLPDFLQRFECKGRLVINNDSDLYSSTSYCLAKLDPIIRSGTIIIFDEYNSALNEFRAWNDYLRSFMRKAKPIAMTEDYAQRVAFLFE